MDADETLVEVPVEVSQAIAGVETAMLTLIKLLGSPDTMVQAGVLAALDGLGVVAIGYLAAGLETSKETPFKIRIVEALGSLAPLSRTTVVGALGAAAMDKDTEVRKAAARVIWGLETPRAPKPRPTPAGA